MSLNHTYPYNHEIATSAIWSYLLRLPCQKNSYPATRRSLSELLPHWKKYVERGGLENAYGLANIQIILSADVPCTFHILYFADCGLSYWFYIWPCQRQLFWKTLLMQRLKKQLHVHIKKIIIETIIKLLHTYARHTLHTNIEACIPCLVPSSSRYGSQYLWLCLILHNHDMHCVIVNMTFLYLY